MCACSTEQTSVNSTHYVNMHSVNAHSDLRSSDLQHIICFTNGHDFVDFIDIGLGPY